eukprot:1005588-Lingulodinium_polyedra.AAC.1
MDTDVRARGHVENLLARSSRGPRGLLGSQDPRAHVSVRCRRICVRWRSLNYECVGSALPLGAPPRLTATQTA